GGPPVGAVRRTHRLFVQGGPGATADTRPAAHPGPAHGPAERRRAGRRPGLRFVRAPGPVPPARPTRRLPAAPAPPAGPPPRPPGDLPQAAATTGVAVGGGLRGAAGGADGAGGARVRRYARRPHAAADAGHDAAQPQTLPGAGAGSPVRDTLGGGDQSAL